MIIVEQTSQTSEQMKPKIVEQCGERVHQRTFSGSLYSLDPSSFDIPIFITLLINLHVL